MVVYTIFFNIRISDSIIILTITVFMLLEYVMIIVIFLLFINTRIVIKLSTEMVSIQWLYYG
jgi:hypothetical protein